MASRGKSFSLEETSLPQRGLPVEWLQDGWLVDPAIQPVYPCSGRGWCIVRESLRGAATRSKVRHAEYLPQQIV